MGLSYDRWQFWSSLTAVVVVCYLVLALFLVKFGIWARGWPWIGIGVLAGLGSAIISSIAIKDSTK